MDMLFVEYLKYNLQKEIKEGEQSTPTITYSTKVTKHIKTHESYITTFKIVSSTIKGKIKNILKPEEKLKISSSKFFITGTILSIEEDEVIVELNKNIDLGEYTIIRQSNYNNEILLKHLETFILNNKKVNKELLDGWITNAILRIKNIYSINLTNENELRNFFVEKKNLCKDVTDEQIAKFIDKIIRYDKNLDCLLALPTKCHEISFYDDLLNESQKMSILEIYNNKSYKIIGPPGTGKTRTIVEIISQLLNLNKKILVCGPSNIAIDNIIERFLKSKYFTRNNTIFYRLGSSVKGLTKYNLDFQISLKTDFIKKEKNERHFNKTKNKLKTTYKADIKENTRIVFSTLFSSLKENSKFDWVIIDEACQSSDVESFLAVEKADHFILVGDPNQLSPRSSSIFEKLSLKTFLLNLQYRMCPNLIRFSNEMFYDKKILSHKIESVNLFGKNPLIFIDTDCSDFNETEDNHSKKNEGEANIICKIVKYIQNNQQQDIGIITPYSAQAALLRSCISENVEVNTVDGFQGREKDFIILSLVRSNNCKDYGFLDDFKRLNVAITRCKKGLIVVGDSQNFRKSQIFTNFFKFIEKNFTVFDPSEIDDIFSM